MAIVGVKFKPTDSILVNRYLAGKVCARTEGPIFPFITEADLYQYEPEQLSSCGPYDFGDNPTKSYFFTVLKMIKTENGRNVDRSVAGGAGFWKKTGKVIDVEDDYKNIIGKKTSLAYYRNDRKTNWLMIEYRLGDEKYDMLEKEYKMVEEKNKRLALCSVYRNGKKRGESKKELGNEKVDHQSSKPITVTAAKYSPLSVPDPNPDFPWCVFLPEDNDPMSSNENLGNTSWFCNIAIPNSHQNMPISGMGYNSQPGAKESIMNSPNFEPVSAPWSSLSTAHNSCLNCSETLMTSPAKNPTIACGSSIPFNLSSNQDGTLESLLGNRSLTPSLWNPGKQDNASSFSAVHCNNMFMGYSQDDQATASIAQIPNCQNYPVMGNSHAENLNHNILTSSHENLNHNLQQSLAFQMSNFNFEESQEEFSIRY